MSIEKSEGPTISEDVVQHLLKCAWNARENAFVIGPTRVGCAVLESNGQAFTGCNVEHKFRSHDVHAEVNAISSMIASGCYTLMIVAVVADRDRFTPCGACMDWIMQFSKGECVIITQAKAGGPLQRYTARELMPFYPL